MFIGCCCIKCKINQIRSQAKDQVFGELVNSENYERCVLICKQVIRRHVHSRTEAQSTQCILMSEANTVMKKYIIKCMLSIQSAENNSRVNVLISAIRPICQVVGVKLQEHKKVLMICRCIKHKSKFNQMIGK